MSYKEIDDFISDLAQPKDVPFGPAATSFLTLKKLAAMGVEEPKPYFASTVEDVCAGLAQVVSYEMQKEASPALEYLLGQLQQLSPNGFTVPNPIEKTAGLQGEIVLEQQSLMAMEKLCHLVGDEVPLFHTLRHLMAMGEGRLKKLAAQIPVQKEKTAHEKLMGRLQKVAKERGPITEMFRSSFPEGEAKIRRDGKTVYKKAWKGGKTISEKGRDPMRGKGSYILERLKTQGGSPMSGSRSTLSGKARGLSPKAKALLAAGGLAAGGATYVASRKKKEKVAQPVVVPAPNNDSPDAYVARERQLQLDQAVQELAHTKMQLNQTAMMAQQAQAEGQQAQQQLQETDQQIQEVQAQADEANQAAQASQQQAVEAEGRAAQHATQKMQLGMRVQQMRQALAEIATQDPVTETASNANDLAAQGAPATPDQIAQEQEQAAAAEEQAAAGGEAPPPADAQKEVEQAQRAQEEADQQTGQAEQQMGGPAAAPAGPAAAPAGGPSAQAPGQAGMAAA
jgi:hypothetical protein